MSKFPSHDIHDYRQPKSTKFVTNTLNLKYFRSYYSSTTTICYPILGRFSTIFFSTTHYLNMFIKLGLLSSYTKDIIHRKILLLRYVIMTILFTISPLLNHNHHWFTIRHTTLRGEQVIAKGPHPAHWVKVHGPCNQWNHVATITSTVAINASRRWAQFIFCPSFAVRID